MADQNITVKHIQRNDTQDNWLLANPILLKGELGVETDTFKIKIGNGVDNYADLPYLNNVSDSGSTISRIETKKVVATEENQTSFQIPFNDFKQNKCFLDIRINSVWINPDKYTVDGQILTLKSGRKAGTEIFFTCHYLENQASNDPSVMEHTHTIADIEDFPSSLPADGGNSDTVGGKAPSDFASNIHRHTISEIDGLEDIGGDVAWDDVTNKPDTFPPSTHNHDTLYAAKAHETNKSNPHGVTKAQVGLDKVNNWGASTSVSSTSTTTYATASAVKQAYDKAVQAYNKANSSSSPKVEHKKIDAVNGWGTFNNDIYEVEPFILASKYGSVVTLNLSFITEGDGNLVCYLPSGYEPNTKCLFTKDSNVFELRPTGEFICNSGISGYGCAITYVAKS